MRTKLIIRSCIAGFWLLNSPILLAGFTTYSKNWPDDPNVVNEKVTSHQEIAQAKPDPSFLVVTEAATEQRMSDFKRLYGKLGATFLNAEIRSITNTSYPALSSGTVVNSTAKENYVSWEFGLGTKFQYVRMELDYLYEKTLQYNMSPLFYNVATESLNSKLMAQSVWFNLMYDMHKLNLPYFTPYFGGLLGVCWNKTRSAMTGSVGNGTAQTHSRVALGWGATFGIRFPFWTRWFGYMDYKYLDHGKVVWKDSSGIMQLKGQYVVQGISVGVQYLLG